MKLQNLKILSLFSGAGGLDLGFINVGHEVVFANDNDKDSCDTYKLNIGNHIECGDVADINLNNLPTYDVLTGGFPCQGFSLANINKKNRDSRNDLYINIINVLKRTTPKFFLLENVRGIKSLNKGKDFNDILSALYDCGYMVSFKAMNAADYGVPQSRIRLIITGVRKDLVGGFEYVYPDPTHFKDPGLLKDLKRWVTIGEALKDIPEPSLECNLPNHICSKYKLTNRNFTGHRRTDPDKPSPTILARGNGGGGVCAIQHPRNHRRLSVRESAIIQTFPLDFVFIGGLMSTYRQVGNAVAVKFAEALASGFVRK